MTDKEIIEALTNCVVDGDYPDSCVNCKYENRGIDCIDTLILDACELLKKQQEKIERLKSKIKKGHKGFCKDCKFGSKQTKPKD